MYLNLGQVCSAATEMAGGRNDWSLSNASFWANQALHEIQRQVWHTPLEMLAYSSTTSGENRVSLPTDFDYPISLSNLSASASPILPMQAGDWIDSQGTTQSGVPVRYALYGTWMELWPMPNSAYSLQLRYGARQPVLIESTSTPTLDERWHSGWLYKTVELLEASRNNAQGEAVARNRYLGHMTSIPTDRALRQQARQGMSVSIPRRWARGW